MGKKLPIIRVIAPPPSTYGEMVARYVAEKRPAVLYERETFAREPTFEAAVHRAAVGLTSDGKVQKHQRRVKPEARKAWAQHLLEHGNQLDSAGTFHHLLMTLEELKIPGINEVTIYDTADRIGANVQLEPVLVYLHGGTRIGARHLGFGRWRRWLRCQELPPPFQVLRPYEVEDCLCMYKNAIGRIVAPSGE